MKKRILTNTEPKEVFKFFEDLTFIPRESENEKQVADYLVQFAKDHGLEWLRDESDNVIIRKSASVGYEDHPAVVMQAHVDMVCAKNPGVEFDFSRKPIEFKVDGDLIIAEDTTLGADDGIGVAIILAVLADPDLKHPEIEALFTTVEEIGLFGVEKVDYSMLKGSYVINVDAADEGVAVIGCAGGDVICAKLPVKRRSKKTGASCYRIVISGLLGGHSGEDIHRGRASAVEQMGRLLTDLAFSVDYDLHDLRGGDKTNSIARSAEAVISIPPSDVKFLEEFISKHDEVLKREYRVTDPGIYIACEKVEGAPKNSEPVDGDSLQRILDYINFSEFGVIRMDQDLPHLVESSSNMGIVRLRGDHAEFWHAVRSSRLGIAKQTGDKIKRLTKLLGGEYSVPAYSPPWEACHSSKLKAIYENVYEDLFGRTPESMIIHAALEPCKIAPRMDHPLDMIALGPDVRHPHSPGEYMTISSCARLWDTIKELLSRL